MNLNQEEKAMLAGEFGPVRKTAIEHQIKVGDFFGAEDFVPVSQAHIISEECRKRSHRSDSNHY
jgi:predicted aconitase